MLERKRTRLVLEFITRATCASGGRITSLNHETAYNAMEGRIVIKAFTRQKHKVVYRDRSLGREQLDLNITLPGMKDRCVFLLRVNLQRGSARILFWQNFLPFKTAKKLPAA